VPLKRTLLRKPNAPTTPPKGDFIPLSSLRPSPSSAAEILAEIRHIYFKTSATSIDADLLHAVALLKTLPDEETRERAAVYMEGLADMRKEWKLAQSRRRISR
jgi:hypothetical protein